MDNYQSKDHLIEASNGITIRMRYLSSIFCYSVFREVEPGIDNIQSYIYIYNTHNFAYQIFLLMTHDLGEILFKTFYVYVLVMVLRQNLLQYRNLRE